MLNYLKNSKLGKTAMAAMTALTLYSSSADADETPNQAQTENLESRVEFDQAITPLDVAIEFGIASGLSLFVHEFGHYAAGQALGHNSRINGPSFITVDGKREWSMASTDFDNYRRISETDWNIINLAGMGTTTLGNIAITNYLVNSDTDNSIRPFLGALSLAMMFDRHFYSLGSSFRHFMPGIENCTGDDIDSLMRDNNLNLNVAYGALVAETIAEIILRWGEISYLWETAIGNNPEYEPTGLEFTIKPTEDTFTVEVSGNLPF